MKNLSSLALLLVGALVSSAASAQQYRPFRFGVSYQLSASATPGDTTHLLRLASRQAQGSDSVFLFDKRTSAGRRLPQSPCGSYVQRTDNLFGASLRLRSGAEYVLTAANGRTLTLRPRAPLGQPWAATTVGLTGSVTARTLGTVLGQADSLATITLSDGAVVVLSKRFGWVSGPVLGRYLNARLPQSVLTLTALPELGLGTERLSAFAVYDFQPGDVFLRRTNSFGSGPAGPCQSVSWTRDSILSRRLSTNGDTLVYQQRSRMLLGACSAVGAPILLPATVQTLRIVRTSSHLNQPTGYWEVAGPQSNGGLVHLPAWRTASFNGRPVQHQMAYQSCGAIADSTALLNSGSLDAGYSASSAPGLGLTEVEFISFSSDITVLVGYRKGTETWGQLTTFAQLLPARTSRPAATTAAFPNPFGAELTVQFTLARSQPMTIELRDALGRVVQQSAPVLLPAGAQQRTLATAALPGGVYTLHLHFEAEGRTEVLRVLKTE